MKPHGRCADDCRSQRKTPGTTKEGCTRSVARSCTLELEQSWTGVFLERNQEAALGMGVTLQSHEVQAVKDFAAAFVAIAEERPQHFSLCRMRWQSSRER